MPDYSMYNLANSREIPRFVGSAIPELTQAAGVLQGRYDQALQYEDAIDTALTEATSLGADTKMLQDLKTQYRGKLSERAKKGDYENMVRETSRDARDFMSAYRPIAANQAAVTAYHKELQDRVEKGKVAKDWADSLYDYSTRNYKGLRRNELTGQLENQFVGTTAVDHLDLPKWIEGVVAGMKDQKSGSIIRFDNGKAYIEQGGLDKHGLAKREWLSADRLAPVIEAAKASDPMYQSYVKQKALVDSYRYGNVSEDTVRNGGNPKLYEAVLEETRRDPGKSFGEALQGIMAQRSLQQTDQQVNAIASKYLHDDTEYVNKNMGENERMGEERSRRLAKEAKETENPFGIDLKLTLPGTEFKNPSQLTKGIKSNELNLTAVKEKNANFMSKVEQVQGADGKMHYRHKDTGEIVDHEVALNAAAEQQANLQVQSLKNREAEAWKQANNGKPYTPPPALVKKAEEKYKERINELYSGSRESQGMSTEEKQHAAQLEYDKVMENTPMFKRFKQILEDDSKNGTVTTTAYQFKDPAANKGAKQHFENFILDMDQDELNGGFTGIQKVDGTKFSNEDYQDVKSGVEFGGWAPDPSEGNRLKFFYNVGKTRTDKDGNLVGKKMVVKTDALPGTEEVLAKTGQLHPLKLLLGQRVGELEFNDQKKTEFSPAKGWTVRVERLNQTERDKYGAGTKPIRMTYIYPDGREEPHGADNTQQVIDALMEAMNPKK